MDYIHQNTIKRYTDATCINITNCKNFGIVSCTFEKYTRAVSYNNSENFIISDCFFYAGNSIKIEDIIDGSYTRPWAAVLTGSIVSWYHPNLPSNNFIIKNNIINNVGLDVAIEMLSQAFDEQKAICTGNIINGSQSGIQIYRGSLNESSKVVTFKSGIIVSNNSIFGCWEQGIYQRGVIGSIITSNKIEQCGKSGKTENNSSNSISCRVNVNAFKNIKNKSNSNDYYSIVSNNTIINHGKDTQSNDSIILIEQDNVLFTGNTITKSAEFSTQTQDTVIMIGNGNKLNNFQIKNNIIRGKFNTGIVVNDGLKNAHHKDYGVIENNILDGFFKDGINVNFYSTNVTVKQNHINKCINGIFIRNTPYTYILSNQITGKNALILNSGCLIGDVSYYRNRSKRKKIGSSLFVENNKFNCDVLIKMKETNPNNSKLWGRLKTFKDNYFQNKHVEYSDLNFTTQSTYNSKSFDKNDTFRIEGFSKMIVKSAGQFGEELQFNGKVQANSNVIQLTSFDGLGEGLYLTSEAFRNVVIITALNYAKNTIEVNENAIKSGTVSIKSAVPIFQRNNVFTAYLNHEAADQDSNLQSNEFYKIKGKRDVFQKP